jgi:enamine deaminase RidA (YjgF/YER057c/UK114 family)
MAIERMNPEGLASMPGLCNVVAATGKTIYLAGQAPIGPDMALVGAGDIAVQAKKVFENIKTALAAAGATISNVVKIVIYVVDYKEEDLQALFAPAYEVFGEGMPDTASTLVGVAALFMPGQRLEVDITAVVD